MEITEGNIYLTKTRKQGDSHYLLVTPAMLEYLGLEPEKDNLFIKAENHKKWGNYFGIGKDKR